MNVPLEAPLSKKKLVQSKLARGEKKEEIKPVPVRCIDGAECRNNGVGAECGKSCYQSRGRENMLPMPCIRRNITNAGARKHIDTATR